MTDLAIAKNAVMAQFKSSLPPNMPAPEQLTLPELLTRPILSGGVVDHGAHDIISGTFQPGVNGGMNTWSTANEFSDAYLQMVQDMAYNLSTADENTLTKLKTANQVVFNNLISTYERVYSPITPAEMAAAGVKTKIDYVTAQFTPTFKASLNWAQFASDYNQAKAAVDIMQNMNSAMVEFGKQITGIKANLAAPEMTNGGTQAYAASNAKVWVPGYNVDPAFPSKFANGNTVKITIDLKDVGQSSSQFSMEGSAGGSFPIDCLQISGATSSQYSESHFQSLMSHARIELEYDNVCYLAASPSGLTANNTMGWYLPQILKQALENDGTQTGPFFAQHGATHKATLEAGALQSLRGLLVSTMPKGKMLFAQDDFSSFQKYFHTQSNASVSLFGFIPLGSASTSYTKSSSGSSESGYAMEVAINPSNDVNNLVVHGAFLEDPTR